MPSAGVEEEHGQGGSSRVPADATFAGEPEVGSAEMHGLCQLQAGAGKGIPKCKPLANLLAVEGGKHQTTG